MAIDLSEIPESDPLRDPEQRKIIEEIVEERKDLRGAPMVVLNELQKRIGYISTPMQEYVADKLGVPVAQIYGVVSFYSFFSTHPKGEHAIKFCMGTACYVQGAPQLIEKAKQILGVDLDETTDDWKITLEQCRCVGACSQAPVVMIDDDVYGRVTPNELVKIIRKYQ